MYYIVLGGLLLVLFFFVFIGIGAIGEYIKEKRIKCLAKDIIDNNPHGYDVYIRSSNIRYNALKIIEAKTDIETYERNYPIVSLWDKWGKEQTAFNKSCRSLFQGMYLYGYYHYQFSTHQIDYSGDNKTIKLPLWHFFLYAYSSHIKDEAFEKKYFSFIFNNNKTVCNLKSNLHPSSSSIVESLVKVINIFSNKYPNIIILFLLPAKIDEKVFVDEYYRPLKDFLPNINLQLVINYKAECTKYKNKTVLLLDLYTSEDCQINVTENILSICNYDAPQIVYLSVYKEHSEKELKAILKEKKDFIEKKESIIKVIDQGLTYIKEAKLEKAGEIFKEAKKEIDDYTKLNSKEIEELTEHLEDVRKESITIYEKIETFEYWNENIKVNYGYPSEFILSENCYAIAKFPQKGCHVYPYRRGKKHYLVGHSEKDFCRTLSNYFPKSIVEFKSDVFLAISENRIIEPDIALIVKNNPSIKIDIEIDEPYEAGNKKPIHYISCGDDIRDDELLRRGWTVIRFSEKQVILYPERCASFLARIVHAINHEFIVPNELMSIGDLPTIKRWTQNEALLMAARNEREEYLHHSISNTKEEKRTYVKFVLNDNEIKCNELTHKAEEDTEFAEKIKSFTEADRFERDKRIGFNAFEHVYINKKNEEHFLSVSSLVTYFFEGFDALRQAELQWERYRIPIEESLFKWDRIGKSASEVGTFLHLQIENFLKNGFFDSNYKFTYNGNTEMISIEKEMLHFQKFIEDYKIKPYRQEWPIYDEDLNIAGTIDLICQVDLDTFIIYDWKRSGKVVNSQGYPNTIAYGGKTGLHGLDLPDTAFFHYCIQQNLYRYILQKNYGIIVKELNLVVLWPEYNTYYKVNVPLMDDIIKHIVHICVENDLGHYLLS